MDASRPSAQVYHLKVPRHFESSSSLFTTGLSPRAFRLTLMPPSKNKFSGASGVPEIGSCFTCRLVKGTFFFVISCDETSLSGLLAQLANNMKIHLKTITQYTRPTRVIIQSGPSVSSHTRELLN